MSTVIYLHQLIVSAWMPSQWGEASLLKEGPPASAPAPERRAASALTKEHSPSGTGQNKARFNWMSSVHIAPWKLKSKRVVTETTICKSGCYRNWKSLNGKTSTEANDGMRRHNKSSSCPDAAHIWHGLLFYTSLKFPWHWLLSSAQIGGLVISSSSV